jgi:hypothetical protein
LKWHTLAGKNPAIEGKAIKGIEECITLGIFT